MRRTNEGPQNVRVFKGDQFLFASYDHGREQILDIRAHDRESLLHYWLDWMNDAPRRHGKRQHRTPEAPRSTSDSDTNPDLPSLKTARSMTRRRG